MRQEPHKDWLREHFRPCDPLRRVTIRREKGAESAHFDQLVGPPLETEDEAIDDNDLSPVRQWLLVRDRA
jgi:hypothetical protein